MPTPSHHAEDSPTALLAELDRRISERFPLHPFEWGISSGNFESVIAEHLAISIAFPYIQAGAIYRNYVRGARWNNGASKNVEITSSIGSFLIWDEFGGNMLTRKYGDEGVLHLTKTDRNFHSNILRHDIEILLGKKVEPKFFGVTRAYMDDLLERLSDSRNNRNVAAMIAFEKHAGILIEAMWSSIERIFSVPKDSTLEYFYEHVGGDSPAEALHVKMTEQMVGQLVSEQSYEQFMADCLDAYAANIRWCEALVSPDLCQETVVPSSLSYI